MEENRFLSVGTGVCKKCITLEEPQCLIRAHERCVFSWPPPPLHSPSRPGPPAGGCCLFETTPVKNITWTHLVQSGLTFQHKQIQLELVGPSRTCCYMLIRKDWLSLQHEEGQDGLKASAKPQMQCRSGTPYGSCDLMEG